MLGPGYHTYTSPDLVVVDAKTWVYTRGPPPWCDGIVDMMAFDQLGDIGWLSSLTSLLPRWIFHILFATGELGPCIY